MNEWLILGGAAVTAVGVALYYNGDLGITVSGYGPEMAYAGIAITVVGVAMMLYGAVFD